ncbi:MAG TPA: hypothetical protein VGI17_06665, partial [Solirubrobacterales bacterium]
MKEKRTVRRMMLVLGLPGREEVKAGRLKLASTHFARAQAALEKTVKQLAAVPGPAADEAKLAKWIGYLEGESSYIGKIGK